MEKPVPMSLEDFRTIVCQMTRKTFAATCGVSETTIYQIETGKPFHSLSRGKILAGLTLYLKRTVNASEIEEFINDV